MGYDGAGNLSWSSAGLAFGTACDDTGTSVAVVERKVARTYDTRNRLLTLSFPDGKGNQVWRYTATGKPATITTYNNTGKLEPVVNGYSYNRRGLMTGETSGQTGWYTWGLGYGYDTFGNLYNVNYADGLSIIYAPNAIGQPTQAGTYATNISYHRNGALKQFTYGNGIVHTMSQNARQLPARSTDSGGVLDLGYTFDEHSNVASITDNTAGARQSRTLTYDNLDRLTQAVGTSFGTATYGYNVLDDITRLTVTGGNKPRDHVYNYNTGTHQLETVNNYVGGAAVIGLQYDPQGNLANKNGQTYGFDYGNRLRTVPSKEQYRYDGHGRRVYSYTNNYAVWQYSNAGQLMFSHDARNNRASNYIYLQGSLLAIREKAMSGGDGSFTVKYQHTDALGSPIKVTDAAGSTVETSEYEPYGHLANRALTDGPGFTGHVQDAASGLTYMQQRYYDPQVGLFLSVDPVGPDSKPLLHLHRYRYANSNPFRYTDIDGRNGVTALGGLVTESWNALNGRGFDGDSVAGALKDGYDGDGGSIASSAAEDVLTLVPASKVVQLAKLVGRGAKALQASGRMARAAKIGREGEAAAGIVKNTRRIPSSSGTAAFRIPVGLTATTLTEVKNYSGKLGLTNQLRDFLSYAKDTHRTFELVVGKETQLTKGLSKLVESGEIVLRRLQ